MENSGNIGSDNGDSKVATVARIYPPPLQSAISSNIVSLLFLRLCANETSCGQ